MSEVKRYHVINTGLAEGTALGRISVVLTADYDRVTAERNNLQNLLNVVDQHNDELAGLLRKLVENPQVWIACPGQLLERIGAALKTTGECKPATQHHNEDSLDMVAPAHHLRDAAKMIGIVRMPPMEYDEP